MSTHSCAPRHARVVRVRSDASGLSSLVSRLVSPSLRLHSLPRRVGREGAQKMSSGFLLAREKKASHPSAFVDSARRASPSSQRLNRRLFSSPPRAFVENLSRRRGLDPHLVQLRLLGELHLVRQPEELQDADAHPGHVDLPPLQTVPRRKLKRVVVVVPPLAERQDADPPVVPRKVAGVVRLAAPDVRHGVHRPRDVVHPARAHAESPHQPGQTPEGVERRRPRDDVPHVRLLQPPVEGLSGDFLCVGPVADAL
mmetsp:Transcript_4810/g.20437  ORF Transcript_4810/g.20437 Transcript_4810/m.20437 type:complete len:255 (+) Transcript_4810:74-838(+)